MASITLEQLEQWRGAMYHRSRRSGWTTGLSTDGIYDRRDIQHHRRESSIRGNEIIACRPMLQQVRTADESR